MSRLGLAHGRQLLRCFTQLCTLTWQEKLRSSKDRLAWSVPQRGKASAESLLAVARRTGSRGANCLMTVCTRLVTHLTSSGSPICRPTTISMQKNLVIGREGSHKATAMRFQAKMSGSSAIVMVNDGEHLFLSSQDSLPVKTSTSYQRKPRPQMGAWMATTKHRMFKSRQGTYHCQSHPQSKVADRPYPQATGQHHFPSSSYLRAVRLH